MFFAYIGYPFVLAVIGNLAAAKKIDSTAGAEPSVSIILIVKNEQARLPGRILNLLELDYPPEKMEIVVVSDGSDDETNSILLEIAREQKVRPMIIPILFQENRGKSVVIPEVVKAA